MIRYKKTIRVQQAKTDQWQLVTDRGDNYDMTPLLGPTALTDWWDYQHKSQLREWQMDAILKELTRLGHSDEYQLFLVHKRGQGLSQPHDIMIFYHLRQKIWILSTQDHAWFVPSAFTECEFNLDHALAVDVTNQEQRKNLYPIIDYLTSLGLN